MVIGWFRQFRHVKMPENTKENDPQPSRSIEPDLDFRTRLAASSDVSEDKRADTSLRIIAEGTAAATGDEFFRSLTRCAAQALGARYAFVAETLSEMESRSLAFWDGSDFGTGFTYRFPGTPCQRVAAGHICVTSSGLAAKFPEDLWLQQIGAESYIGVPMRNAQGRTLGHLAVLHQEPMEPSEEDIAVLQIFAARGCAELERKQAHEKLSKAHEDLRRLNLETAALLDVNRAIGHHLDRVVLFGALADCLQKVVPTDRFGIVLPTRVNQLQGYVLTKRDVLSESLQSKVFSSEGTATAWVLQNREWIVAGSVDEMRDRFPATARVMQEAGMQSLCELPLLSGVRVLGSLIFMSSKKAAYAYLQRSFLQQVASSVAVALDDCLAHEEVRRLGNELSARTISVRAWPRCRWPVGEGARRPRYFGIVITDCRFTLKLIKRHRGIKLVLVTSLISCSKVFVRICRQPFGQTRQRRGQNFLHFGNVQRRVQRARRPGKIFGRTGFDFGFDFRPAFDEQFADLPARKFFRAGDVKNSRAIFFRQFPNRPRRFDRRNRRAKFVREQCHPLPRLQRPPQLFVEAAIARARNAAVDGSAHDQMARIFQNDLLGGSFGFAVKMQRIRRVGLGVISLAPVKNQIRGKENELEFPPPVPRAVCVTSTFTRRASAGFFCASPTVGNRGAMDDELRLVFLKFAADGGEIKQIKSVARQRAHAPARGESRRGLDEIISNEPVRAGDPNERLNPQAAW